MNVSFLRSGYVRDLRVNLWVDFFVLNATSVVVVRVEK